MKIQNLLALFLLLPCFASPLCAQQVLNIIGDSYVANHRRPKEEAWHYKMATNLGLTYNNYGRNGSCVAFDRTHDGKYNFGPAMWVRYKEMDPTADYVIIIAGHNDAGKVNDNPDSLRMFCDSLEALITGIQQLCPKAKIGYVTPWYVDRPGFQSVCKTIKKVCKRHHIPVLWNYTSKCVIQVRNDDFRRQYFQGPNDTAHLNAAGHDLFLPIGTAWFQKYMLKRP
ncbi:MAG: SGNH/GDSL hydrolase family protein [Bacteroidaceae bacterium]|nr:SGNH/GDSL hydrolase family protein [Bacteroidaceae bacterium]